jgi:hypothetical protein
MKTLYGIVIAALLLTSAAVNASTNFFVDVESGAAFNGYNDVRIPGDTGTEISLSEDLESEATAFWRARVTADLGEKHSLSLLVAPLRIEASGRLDRDVIFNGVKFASGEDVNSRYRFDSYRLSYSYALLQSDRARIKLGVTAKIRDASIEIEGGDSSSEKTNTGFVPLINFALDWSFASRWGMLLAGDALAAPQGRAEDVLLAVYTDVADFLRLRLGYRLLEGGADNDEVYNFTAVHYLSFGVTAGF